MDGMLSQEEINALLSGLPEEPAEDSSAADEGLSSEQKLSLIHI